MINHPLAAFTPAERGRKKKSVSATVQRANLTICFSSRSVCCVPFSYPTGGCLCGILLGFLFFPATDEFAFRFGYICHHHSYDMVTSRHVLPVLSCQTDIIPRRLRMFFSHVTSQRFLMLKMSTIILMMLQNPSSLFSSRELPVCLW